MSLCVVALWSICYTWAAPVYVVLPAASCTPATTSAIVSALATLDGDGRWQATALTADSDGAYCAPPPYESDYYPH